MISFTTHYTQDFTKKIKDEATQVHIIYCKLLAFGYIKLEHTPAVPAIHYIWDATTPEFTEDIPF